MTTIARVLIVSAVIALILVLLIHLFHDCEFFKTFMGKIVGMKGNINKAMKPSGVRLVNCPVISIKEPGCKEYTNIEMSKKTCTIGSSNKCDIVLYDETVERKHAKIEKKLRGNDTYYEFTNLATCNPSEHQNKKTNKWEELGNKRGLVLDNKEVFCFGETMVIFRNEFKEHEVIDLDSDMSIVNDNDGEPPTILFSRNKMAEIYSGNNYTTVNDYHSNEDVDI